MPPLTLTTAVARTSQSSSTPKVNESSAHSVPPSTLQVSPLGHSLSAVQVISRDSEQEKVVKQLSGSGR